MRRTGISWRVKAGPEGSGWWEGTKSETHSKEEPREDRREGREAQVATIDYSSNPQRIVQTQDESE